MKAAKKALTPAQGDTYELPVIQDVDAYGVDGGTSLKFSVISSDRHIASVHARLNADQAVALVRGTKLALRPDAGDEDGAQARIVTRVRAVRQESAANGTKGGYLNIVTETENGPLVLRIAPADAADLASLLNVHALTRD
jgi:hypothetical protein